MVNKELVLLRLEGCPYCKRAEKELDKRGLKYRKIDIDRNDRSIVEKLSDQPTVPILVEVIGSESQDDEIVQWLEERDS